MYKCGTCLSNDFRIYLSRYQDFLVLTVHLGTNSFRYRISSISSISNID